MAHSRLKPAAGFTLIEVLIAILVIGIGLLSVVSLQTRSVAMGNAAYFRSQASALAYDAADRIRANAVVATAGGFHGLTPTENAACMTAAGCGAAQMAAHDMFLWQREVDQILANGIGIVCRDTTPDDGVRGSPACDGGGNYVIKLWWDDNKDAVDEHYTMSFDA